MATAKKKKKAASAPKKTASKQKAKSASKPVAPAKGVRSKEKQPVGQAKPSPLVGLRPHFAELMKRVEAIDWVKVSDGSEGASFPKDLRAYLTKLSTAALDVIWKKQTARPLGALSARFLMELLAHPDDLKEVPHLLRLLVAMIASNHERLLGAPFAAESAGFSFSRLNKWSAIAERRDLVFALLDHADEKIRAHAAFVLAWLGRAYSGTIVPELWKKTKDPSALVRASALLAIGVHGEDGPVEDYLKDEEPRVGVAAAIAKSHAPRRMLGDDDIDALGYAVNANLTWPDLPFCNGDLTSYAIKCILGLEGAQAERVRPWLARHLDGPLASEVTEALVARTFPQGQELFPLSEEKTQVLALIVNHPSTHMAAVVALGKAGFLLGGSRRTDQQIDTIRKLVGLPRPAPAQGVLAEVEHEGEKRFAQHWLADFSEDGKPEARALARSMAEQLTPKDVIDLLLACYEIETDVLVMNPAATFATPVPEGGTLRDDGTIIFPPEDWPRRARLFMNQVRAEGWFISSEWWHGSTVSVVAHRDGQRFSFTMGNDWNQGNPIRTEAFFKGRQQFSLASLLAETALAHRPGYEEALLARVKETPPGRSSIQLHHRLTNIVIWSWGPGGTRPPKELDTPAIEMEAFWTYVQGPFRAYARMLDDARREELVLRVFEASEHRVPELYAIAPTERVRAKLAPEMKRRIRDVFGGDREKAIAALEWQMAEHARALVDACGTNGG